MTRLKILLFLFLKNPLAGAVAVFQAIRKKLLLDYRLFSHGFAFLPSTIVFHPTARCNLRCRMCVVDSYDFSQELTLGQIKKIIDQLAFFKPHFYLAGGEPLLRTDLEKIILSAKKRGLITTLTTNGVLLDSQRARKLIDAGLDGMSVSIDGPRKINDQIRGKGNFEKTMAAIGALQEIRQKKRMVLPRLKIATVISGLSYPHLEEMVSLAEDLGVEEIIFFHLDYKFQKMASAHRQCLLTNFNQPIGCLGYLVANKPSLEEKRFIAVDTGILKKQMQKITRGKHSVSVVFAPNVPLTKIDDYYQGRYFKDFSCTNPWFSATILPNGDLVPCFSLKIGNLGKRSFRELWNSDLYQKFRSYLKKYGHFPGCFRCCGTSDI